MGQMYRVVLVFKSDEEFSGRWSHLPGLPGVDAEALHESEYLLVGLCLLPVPEAGARQQAGRLLCHPPVLLDLVHCVPLPWLQHKHLPD